MEFSFTRDACDPVYWIMCFQCWNFIKTAADLRAKQVYEQILNDNRTLFW